VTPSAPPLAAVIAMLVFATAVIVTTEFIVVGLLPMMARDLQISVAEAGAFVTWFALSSAVFGPAITIAVGKLPPRGVLVVALLVFGPGNLAAAIAADYPVVAAVRVVQGAALPVFVSVANAAVAHLAGAGREGRAIALVNLGVVLGIVLAVPAGVAIADLSSWQTSFVGLAILATLATAIIAAAFPPLENLGHISMRAQASVLRQHGFQAHLLLSGVLFTAMFIAYTYLAAYLETVGGFDGRQVAGALMGFGAAGLFGNWIAGRVVDRGPTAATAGAAFVLALATAAVSLGGGRPMLLLPVLALWGAAHAAAFVLCQVRVMLAGPQAPAFASSLNISVCNVGIAAGAAAGGWIVERHGIESIGFGGAVLAVGALVIAFLVWKGSDPSARSSDLAEVESSRLIIAGIGGPETPSARSTVARSAPIR
jgi:MFS transporter, DHA1 family, inner membrane transport protein